MHWVCATALVDRAAKTAFDVSCNPAVLRGHSGQRGWVRRDRTDVGLSGERRAGQ